MRDYGIAGQLGLEPTLAEHVAAMVKVFDEVWHVLRKDGTCWINYGDSYAASVNGRSAEDTRAAYAGHKDARGDNPFGTIRDGSNKPFSTIGNGLKPKDLCGVPWRVAFALQERGWWLRQDIIWAKPNPMPESIRDRCTKAHEYIFLLAKSERYYFDQEAISEPVTGGSNPSGNGRGVKLAEPGNGIKQNSSFSGAIRNIAIADLPTSRNKRSVWTIATAPYAEAHFATFPPELPELCIKAGTSQKGCCAACGAPWVRELSEAIGGSIGQGWHDHSTDIEKGQSISRAGKGGNGYQCSATLGWSPSCQCNTAIVPATVLDPFGGAGTTGLVADRLQRQAILIELNSEYAAMARRRIDDDRGGLLDLMEAAE